MKLYFGCSQWGYESWRGSLYPENSASGDLLRYYSRMFNAVELNPTFYNGADPAAMMRWKHKVDENFRFCPKVPKRISHEKKLSDIDNELNDFLTGVNFLGPNLGVIFLQLSNHFGAADLESLNNFLAKVPGTFKISVEPRIPMMQEEELLRQTLSILRENNAGIVITDSIESREYVNSLRLTNHTAFIRFISYGHETDFQRLDEWFAQIEKWNSKGLPESYFFLHFPNEQNETGLVNHFLRRTESLMII